MPSLIDACLVRGPVEYAALGGFPADAGGECVFLGRTRAQRHPELGDLLRLEYEGYAPMAERLLRELAEAAIARWRCGAVRVRHALGPVPVGEASVLVQVAAGHRDGAFSACRFLIDRLKAEAPIWKREVWSGGATWSPGATVLAAGPADLAMAGRRGTQT